MSKAWVIVVALLAGHCFAGDVPDGDIPLWERCYELIEIERNLGGRFTTSLRESAYAGSCSGTIKTISAMGDYFDLGCNVPEPVEAAKIIVDKKIVRTFSAAKIFCR